MTGSTNQDPDFLNILPAFGDETGPTPTRFGLKVTGATFDLNDALAILKLKRVRRVALHVDTAFMMMDVNLAKMLQDPKKIPLLVVLASKVLKAADEAGYKPTV
jgi:hypothetical protein